MSDIGNGWIPALINDQTELDFIRESQRGLSNNHDYYIGGTTQDKEKLTYQVIVLLMQEEVSLISI